MGAKRLFLPQHTKFIFNQQKRKSYLLLTDHFALHELLIFSILKPRYFLDRFSGGNTQLIAIFWHYDWEVLYLINFIIIIIFFLEIEIIIINPFSHIGHCVGPLSKNFSFSLIRDRKKISYERLAYESVDDKSLS